MFEDLLDNLQAIEDEVQSKVKPQNIKKGVTIFNIEGTLDANITQEKEVNPDRNEQVIIPTNGATSLSKVIVHAITPAIDRDITADKISAQANILGVQGILSPMPNTDYITALNLTNNLLGVNVYVVGNTLVDNDGSVAGNVLSVPGTVVDGVLILS